MTIYSIELTSDDTVQQFAEIIPEEKIILEHGPVRVPIETTPEDGVTIFTRELYGPLDNIVIFSDERSSISTEIIQASTIITAIPKDGETVLELYGQRHDEPTRIAIMRLEKPPVRGERLY